MIYLDNAATTRMDPRVAAELVLHLTDDTYANPGSIHAAGSASAELMSESRESVSRMFGCEPRQVIFTSGGSEGNSLVIRGILPHLKELGRTELIVSASEHESVLQSAKWAAEQGFDLTILPVNRDGCVEPHVLEAAITDQTGLVSVMYVNNELGGVNDVEAIGKLCRSYGALYHTDCVQAAGALPLPAVMQHCDFATISAHKFHGPKGVGAVYVRLPGLLEPLIHGGARQEFGVRGGTENVPGIAAMAIACDIISPLQEMHDEMCQISAIKQGFYTELTRCLEEAGHPDAMFVNGPAVVQSGKILSLRFPGVDAETLILALSQDGVCVSAGSACQAHSANPSHVLLASGLSSDDARSTIRVSFSRFNTEQEVLCAARLIAQRVCQLLEMR